LGEPLVHFLLFGAIVYAFDTPSPLKDAAPPEKSPSVNQRIVVTDTLIDDLRRTQRDLLERVPTDAEVNAAVERWVQDEMLVREALRRDLHVQDAIVRQHLAKKMAFLINAREAPRAPTEDELRAIFEAEGSDFRVIGRVSLRQIFIAGTDAAARVQAESILARVVQVDALDEIYASTSPPPGGPVLRGRRPERLRELYGDAFVVALADVPTGQWGLVPSNRGWHVVKVLSRQEGRALTFEEASARILARWRRDQLDDATHRAMDALRQTYEVVGWPR